MGPLLDVQLDLTDPYASSIKIEKLRVFPESWPNWSEASRASLSTNSARRKQTKNSFRFSQIK